MKITLDELERILQGDIELPTIDNDFYESLLRGRLYLSMASPQHRQDALDKILSLFEILLWFIVFVPAKDIKLPEYIKYIRHHALAAIGLPKAEDITNELWREIVRTLLAASLPPTSKIQRMQGAKKITKLIRRLRRRGEKIEFNAPAYHLPSRRRWRLLHIAKETVRENAPAIKRIEEAIIYKSQLSETYAIMSQLVFVSAPTIGKGVELFIQRWRLIAESGFARPIPTDYYIQNLQLREIGKLTVYELEGGELEWMTSFHSGNKS